MRYFRFLLSCLVFFSIVFISCKSTDQIADNNTIDNNGIPVPESNEASLEQPENPLTHIIEQNNVPEIKASDNSRILMDSPENTGKDDNYQTTTINSDELQKPETSTETLQEASGITENETSTEQSADNSKQTSQAELNNTSENENKPSSEILNSEKSYGSISSSANSNQKEEISSFVPEAEPVLNSEIIQSNENTLKIPSEQEKIPVSEPEVKELSEFEKKTNEINKLPEIKKQEEKENKASSPSSTNTNSKALDSQKNNTITLQNSGKQEEPSLAAQEKVSKEPSSSLAENNKAEEKASDSEKTSTVPEGETKAPVSEENQETASPAVITPSRSVDIKKNQYLDIVYPGSGWVYGGESSKPELLRYFGRRTGSGNTTFSLRSLKGGKTVLHFYKNDALTGEYIDDYLAVNISNDASKTTARVKAPDYASIIPSKPERRGVTEFNGNSNKEKTSDPQTLTNEGVNKNPAENTSNIPVKAEFSDNKISEQPEKHNNRERGQLQEEYRPADSSSNGQDDVKTVISTAQKDASKNLNESAQKNSSESVPAIPETAVSSAVYGQFGEPEMNLQGTKSEEKEEILVIDDSLLEKAIKLYNEKNYEESLKLCELYIANASTRLDEAYFLCGQNYESESSIKDIKKSIQAYKNVTELFPFSKKWKNADQRVIYLSRFYINIR